MKYNSIIIVGGGSAGWMTAATLAKITKNKSITLIESPNIATVGVGESTIGDINQWLSLLQIEDKDFMKYCDASYKLSIRFENFYKKDDGGFHYPFGQPYLKNNKYGLNDWYYKKIINPDLPTSDYAECYYPQMALVKQNKFFKNEDEKIPFAVNKDTAYHFDATKLGLWLRDHYCIPRGVKHIKEDIDTIEQDENGIISLNKKHKADLFIDCTGFKSLLLGETLKEPFESYSHMLPNNKAWATRIPYTDKEKELRTYTNCTALGNGWVWNIPLWSRIGTGYVYSNKHITDEEALDEFKNYLGRDDLKFKNISMRVGIHDRIFVKNVCAIGLSAGFIEPLESNGLYTVHNFLMKLVDVLKRDNENISQFDKDTFNLTAKARFRTFAEFVAMHYALSHRDDTSYWKEIKNKKFDENSNINYIQFVTGFTHLITDKTIRKEYKHVGDGIACIATGLNYFPISFEDIVTEVRDRTFNMKDFKNKIHEDTIHLDNQKELWYNTVQNEKSIYDYLKDFYNENSIT